MSFLDAEEAIVSHYEQRVGAKIYTADELSELEERQQITPSVHVIYAGYEPTQELAGGAVQEIEHTWWAVVCVKSASQRNQAGGKRRKAAEIIDEVIEATIGWRPDKAHSRMKFSQAPSPGYSNGFAYFPLGFKTRTQHRGAS